VYQSEQPDEAFVWVSFGIGGPAAVWANGHKWAERQAISDRLGPAHFQLFFERWAKVVPMRLGEHDREAGYWWELSMRQVEVSPHDRLRRPPTGASIFGVGRHRQHRPWPAQ
jgi:hypothetical protein